MVHDNQQNPAEMFHFVFVSAREEKKKKKKEPQVRTILQVCFSCVQTFVRSCLTSLIYV